MKTSKLVFLIISHFMVFGTSLSAQSKKAETVFRSQAWSKVGFMAAANIGSSRIDRANAFMLNSRSGVVFSDQLTIGGFYNFSLNKFVPKSESTPDVYLDYKALGGLLEYTILSGKVVHATFPILFGGGQVEFDREGHDSDLGRTNFLMVEPGILCEVNLHDFVRLNAGITYRYIGKMSYQSLNESKLSGLSGQLGLKVGLFKKQKS